MSRFRKEEKKEVPAVSTASLPDIVFMLLFFFMVTTVMREIELKVEVDRPEATEVTLLDKKSMVDYIYIGKPNNEKLGTNAVIQLDDQIITSRNKEILIQDFTMRKRDARPENERPFVITSLKVDKTTKMGIVTRVKEQLREVDQLRIAYSTVEK